MKIIIHRGTKEIGGTCVELATKNSRIILDFGMPLSDGHGSEFDERALQDDSVEILLKKKVLYPIKGLYTNDTPSVDAILISHSHKDHYGFLKYAHSDISVYMSAGARKLIDVLNIFIHANSRLELKPTREVQDRKTFTIGDFKVTPYLVDHSAFDAMAFLIEDKVSGKSLFYSGDFRATGWKGKLFDRFVANPPKGVTALLLEGTMMERGGGKYATEEDVRARMVALINESENKVIFACCSGQNIDRIVTFYKAALKTQSLLVLDPYTACVLKSIETSHNRIPQMDWDSVRVFIANYRGKGDIYVAKIMDSDFRWLRQGLGRAKLKPCHFSDLKQKAIVLMRTTMIPAVSQIAGIKGSKLVYSLWDGYLKKTTPDAKKFKAFVSKYDLDLEHVHTSGHATVDKLQQYAAAIAPQRVVPIHTNAPKEYKAAFPNVLELEDGQMFDLNTL